MDTTDKEMQKSSEAIDRALSQMDKTNRGEIAVNILKVVRDLNDHVAWKLWTDIEQSPSDRIGINNVA